MVKRIFPTTVDNTYRGHVVGKWLLIFYVCKSIFAASVHMFASDGGAQSIATITLDQFTSGGADTVVTIFGLWGMEQMVIAIFAALILWRYKALIPMVAGIYVIEYLGRFLVGFVTPGVATTGTPPGVSSDLILIPLTLVMLALTLYQKQPAADA